MTGRRRKKARLRPRPDLHLIDLVRGVEVHTVVYAPPGLDASGWEALKMFWFRVHLDAVERQRLIG